jgi:hypothetical protein
MEGLISAQEGRGDGATARIARCGCDAAGRPLWSSSAARTAIRIAASDLEEVTRDVRNAAQSLHDGEAQDAAQTTELERLDRAPASRDRIDRPVHGRSAAINTDKRAGGRR